MECGAKEARKGNRMCGTGTAVSTCDIRAGLTLGVDTQSTAVRQNALGRGNTVMPKWFVGGILYSLLPANPLLVYSDSALNTGWLTKEERLERNWRGV